MTIEEYSKETGVSIESLLGRSRKKEIAISRQVYWHYLHFKMKLSFMELGRRFGRNHATIISGIKKVSEMMDVNDPSIRKFKQFIQ